MENNDHPTVQVRGVNEFVYCPRLFHLMYVEGRWEENEYTIEGTHVHRRVDAIEHILPEPGEEAEAITGTEGDDPPAILHSVSLSSTLLGLTGKLDLVSLAPDPDGVMTAVPVDTKRGKAPSNELRSYEPERVQLMAQGLLLREQGYRCDHGILYFAGSRQRVTVHFTDELEELTRASISHARSALLRKTLPPPLEESPRCIGCSLNGICLPDETRALRLREASSNAPSTTKDDNVELRRMFPARDPATPLYIQEQGAYVRKKKNSLVITKEDKEIGEVRTREVSQLVLCGRVGVSHSVIHHLCELTIPIVHLSLGYWFFGITSGIALRNSYTRAAQFAAATKEDQRLQFAKKIVHAKILNQRTLLRRNTSSGGDKERVLRKMGEFAEESKLSTSRSQLLGIEGNAARSYFSLFGGTLAPKDLDASFSFEHRNRRPPRDPVNALLSFGYALLAKECTVALMEEGLDPWWGLYHEPRHGRPALALDLMEPFRPLIVDSAVITAINTGMVQRKHFTIAKSGCMLEKDGRRGIITAYEHRLGQLITHPEFNYRCSWRAMIRLHARLLARWLQEDIPDFNFIVTR